ncbi:MAG: RNA-guided endonuclease InsQ/TnpB family protein [Candidatus Hermodarchaeia archaeon]
MRRTNTVTLKPTTVQHQQLLQLAEDCARLWNELTYRRRQSLFRGHMTWDWQDLYDTYKDAVGSATAQQIERKNSEAWRAFFALLRLKKKEQLPSNINRVSPPGYWKDRDRKTRKLIIVLRCDSYRFDTNTLRLPKKLDIKWQGKPRWVNWTKQGRLTIQFDAVANKWYARQPVEVIPPHQPLSNRRAYVDLGVINLLTIAMDGEHHTWTYSGRPALADWWYLSRRIDRLKSVSKTVNGRESTQRIRRIFRRRQLRFRYYVNVVVRHAMRTLWSCGVSVIVMGNLTGILERTSGRRKSNVMRHNFWSHQYLLNRITEVAEEYGMTVKLVDERGTSSTCPRCEGNRVIRRGRLFKCRGCGLEAHRDTVGSINISVVFGGRVNGVVAHPVEVRVGSPQISRR